MGISTALKTTITTYTSTGYDNVNATITVSGGKIKISYPDVWVKNITVSTDSLKLSANYTEQ